MAFKVQVMCLLLVASAGFISAKATPWSMRSAAVACSESDDIVTCTKDQFLSFIDSIFQRDSFKIFNDIEVTRNGEADNMVSARSDDLAVKLEKFVQSRDIKFQVPASDATITYSAAGVDGNEMSFKVNFGATGRAVEARKSKLKKIFIPILVFVLLKAMTLIPLALGVLGIKAWNALQLSFFSFITSTALAIFQLCKKIAAEHHHPQIAAHGPWDAARSFDAEPVNEDAQNLAYNAFA